MQSNAPIEVIRRYYRDVWEARNPAEIPTLFSPDYRNHAGSRGTLEGPDGIRKNYDGLLEAFPDAAFELADLVCEGDKVVVRYLMRATHSGQFLDTPATGTTVEVAGIGIYRVEDGMIRESWVVRDSLSLLKQIGAAD